MKSDKGKRNAQRSEFIEGRLLRIGAGLVEAVPSIDDAIDPHAAVPEAGRSMTAVTALRNLHEILNGKPGQMNFNANLTADELKSLTDEQLAQRMADAQRVFAALSTGADSGESEADGQD